MLHHVWHNVRKSVFDNEDKSQVLNIYNIHTYIF